MVRQILLVDGDEVLRTTLETALNLYNFTVQGADRGDDITELIVVHHPVLVLIDYMLKGLNGGQVCNLIKTNRNTNHIPVILMSAYHKSAIDLVDFKYDAYMPKPFDIKKLVLTINRLLK